MTPQMTRLWQRACLLERTASCYGGMAFPQPGYQYPQPAPGTFLHAVLFAACATDEEYEAELERIRADMLAWRAKLADVPARGSRLSPDLLAKVNFSI